MKRYELNEIMQNGSSAWAFVAHWAKSLYNLSQIRRDRSGWNCCLPNGEKVSIKCVTAHGVAIQCSKNIGSGRETVEGDLTEACDRTSWFIFADISAYPNVVFIPVRTGVISFYVKKGVIKTTGMDYETFSLYFGKEEPELKDIFGEVQ